MTTTVPMTSPRALPHDVDHGCLLALTLDDDASTDISTSLQPLAPNMRSTLASVMRWPRHIYVYCSTCEYLMCGVLV